MAAHPETSRTTKLVLWASGIATFILVLLAVRYLTREKVEIRVGHVEYGDIVKTSSTNGKVQPIDDFQAHSQAPGVVEQIYVNLGDHVKPGQLLIRLDDADARSRLATAQSTLTAARNQHTDLSHGGTQDERNANASDLAKAQLQLTQDQNSLAALEQLSSKGAASPAELAAARQRIQADQNSINAIQQHSTNRYSPNDIAGAQARISDAQAAVSAAQAAVNNVVIRSPLSGTVYSLPVAQYDYVPAGEDLIYVADLARVRVNAYFDEPEVGNLAVGQPVNIVWEAKPGRVWHGHVSIAPTTIITYGTRNVGECVINIDDANGDLLPNTNVTVTVTTSQRKHVLTVPREAVHTDNAQHSFVFRVMNGKLVQTPVVTGLINLVRAEIVSGLSDADTIALAPTTAGRELSNGMDVAIAH
jgi:HlyD family secretion protein